MKSFIIKFLAKRLVNLLPGSKTKLLAWVSYIIGAYNIIIETSLLKSLCAQFNWCLEGSQAWGTIVMLIGFLTDIFTQAKDERAQMMLTDKEYSNLKKSDII